MGRMQVYCAVSLDGFIAGVNDDLSWLGEPDANQQGDLGTVDFNTFFEQVGAILMGRRTYDVVNNLGIDWPYGTTPVFVATSRPITNAAQELFPCQGQIRDLCKQTQQCAGERNVYLDGGQIISQALDADCIDEMILTVVPLLLGQGVRLYNGNLQHRFRAEYLGRLGTMLQIKLTNTGKLGVA